MFLIIFVIIAVTIVVICEAAALCRNSDNGAFLYGKNCVFLPKSDGENV